MAALEDILIIASRRNKGREGLASAQEAIRKAPEKFDEAVAELDWAVEFLNGLVKGKIVISEEEKSLVRFIPALVEALGEETVVLPSASDLLARRDFSSRMRAHHAFKDANKWEFLNEFRDMDWWAGMAPGVYRNFVLREFPALNNNNRMEKKPVQVASALEEALAIGVLRGEVGDNIVNGIRKWFFDSGEEFAKELVVKLRKKYGGESNGG